MLRQRLEQRRIDRFFGTAVVILGKLLQSRDIASLTLYNLLPIRSNSSSYSPDRRSSFHVLSSFLVA